MRKLLLMIGVAAFVVAEAALVLAQTCPCPPTVHLAYEPVARGDLFRGIDACDPGNTSLVTKLASPELAMPTPFQVSDPFLGISYTVRLKRYFADVTGALKGPCYTVSISGFEDPKAPFTVVDGCGTHTINVNAPAFLCSAGGALTMCYESKNIAPIPPLPAGYDRAEDVCDPVTVL